MRLLRCLFAAFALIAFAGCNEVDLYNNLKEPEANEMITLLTRSGIDSIKGPGEEGTFKISVPKSRFAEAVAILKSNGLPRDKFTEMGEVFKKSGLVSSPTEERIRFMSALSDSIAETITHIDGVITARVHIVLPNNDPFADKVQPSSAAVFIKHRASADLESYVPQVKNLVINSIEGVDYEKVSVALFPADEPVTAHTAMSADARPVEILSLRLAPESVPRFYALLAGAGALIVIALGIALTRGGNKAEPKPVPAK